MASSSSSSKLRPAEFITVAQLKPGTHGHNLVVKVVSSSIVVEKARTDRTRIRVAEVVVGDHTGTIIFTARNEQIDVLTPGSTVIVRNAKIDMFHGFMRLAVDKWGSVKAAETPATFQVLENNMSLVEYELVSVPDDAIC